MRDPKQQQTHDRDSERLRAAARSALNERAAALDAATLSRLNRARQSAVAAADRGRAAAPPRRLAYWFSGSLAMATAMLLAVVLWQGGTSPDTLPDALADDGWLSDFELIELEDDLELVEEPEFYDWLSRQADRPDSA